MRLIFFFCFTLFRVLFFTFGIEILALLCRRGLMIFYRDLYKNCDTLKYFFLLNVFAANKKQLIMNLTIFSTVNNIISFNIFNFPLTFSITFIISEKFNIISLMRILFNSKLCFNNQQLNGLRINHIIMLKIKKKIKICFQPNPPATFFFFSGIEITEVTIFYY